MNATEPNVQTGLINEPRSRNEPWSAESEGAHLIKAEKYWRTVNSLELNIVNMNSKGP